MATFTKTKFFTDHELMLAFTTKLIRKGKSIGVQGHRNGWEVQYG